jgi:hypothetical protein
MSAGNALRRILHERWRTRVSLLAAGCLEGHEREVVRHHLETCGACRQEHAEAIAVLEMMAADPAREAETPIAVEFLVKRVEARLEQVQRSRPYRWGLLAASLGVATALLFVVPRFLAPVVSRVATPDATRAARVEGIAMDAAELDRLDRTMARERAVRYLNEAQDVLVTMAAHTRPCGQEQGHVEVGDEVFRSRELLARRALLVEMDADGLAPARPVLEDVEYVLREVAALESCARGGDVERVQRELERRRLLMKIRLMSRELTS